MKSMMSPGEMRHLIEIQEESRTDDEGGGYTREWKTIHTTRAAVRKERGRADPLHEKITEVQTYKFVFRYRDWTITERQRVMWGKRTFRIRDWVNPEERGRYIEITGEENVAD